MQRLQRVTTAHRTQLMFKKPFPEFWNRLRRRGRGFRLQASSRFFGTDSTHPVRHNPSGPLLWCQECAAGAVIFGK